MGSIGDPKPLLYSSAVFAAIAFLLFLGFLAQIGLFAFLYLFGALLPAIGAVLAVAFILFPPYTRKCLRNPGVHSSSSVNAHSLEFFYISPFPANE